MERPPLYNQRTSLNLDPRDLEQAAAIVGDKGRDVMRDRLDRA